MKTLSKLIRPGKTIGIIGGGQLGRMLALSAKARGYRIAVLDPTPDCPAAQVADWHIQKNYTDKEGLLSLAECSDVLTYEFENVDAQTIQAVQQQASFALPQGTALLEITQNRLKEKEFLKKAGIPIADYAKIESENDLTQAVRRLGYPAVLKTVQGGYDGKGQVVLRTHADWSKALDLINTSLCVLEKWIVFDKELSVMVARGLDQKAVTLPPSENIHQDNILMQSIVPARVPKPLQAEASRLAVQIAEHMNLAGVLGVECFLTKEGKLYVNELAPRPHNSGHYSIEACSHSQFDLHIRAICGYPLPEPKLLMPAVMANLLGEHFEAGLELNTRQPAWHIHDYGKKENKIGRKMGHVTVLTESVEAALKALEQTKIWK